MSDAALNLAKLRHKSTGEHLQGRRFELLPLARPEAHTVRQVLG